MGFRSRSVNTIARSQILAAYRIGGSRVLLSVCPSAAIVAAFLFFSVICYAAIDDDVFCCWRPTVTPIAQMKPKSSRSTAVTTCC